MTEHDSRSIARIDWILLGVLLVLVLPMRVWVLHNTEVCARDGIGYIRYALMFEQLTVSETLQKNHQHPGYPALVYLVSQPIRAWQGETPDAMVLSAQLVNLMAALVLVFPMYFLGRQFYHRGISFGATLLYQYLPISSAHLSDAISEPVYLVFLVSAVLQMVQTMRERCIMRGILCGTFAGLAYLVRPEGALVLLGVAGALCVGQMIPAWRVTWQRVVSCGLATVGTAILVGATYAIIIGGFTNKPSVNDTMKAKGVATAMLSDNDFLFATTFAPSDLRTVRLQRSVTAVAMEITQGLHYVGVIPALLGGLAFFRSLRGSLGFWAVAIYAAVHTTVLVMLAMSVSYVSDRHVMILVVLASYLVIAAIDELPRRLLAKRGEGTPTSWTRSPIVWSLLIAGVFFAACLPKAMQHLHGNRAGNHAAGLWLAERVVDGDVILDNHNWSHYYAGHLFQEGREPTVPSGFQPTCYVVVTRSRDPELAKERDEKFLTPDARVVYHWPTDAAVANARVIVYAQKRNAGMHPWKKGP